MKKIVKCFIVKYFSGVGGILAAQALRGDEPRDSHPPNMLFIHRLKHGKKAKELAKDVGRLLLAYRAEGVVTIPTDSDDISPHKLWIYRKRLTLYRERN